MYILKDERAVVADISKLTASKLLPIKSAIDFERKVTFTAMIQYMLGGRSSRRVWPSEYTIKLCIVLIKEKKKNVAIPLIFSIICDTAPSLTIGESGGDTNNLQRKQLSEPYYFSAAKLCISVHALIETTMKQSNTISGVPIGQTNTELVYNIIGFICGGKEDVSLLSSGGNEADNDVIDDDLVSTFTLLNFRKDLMLMALSEFAEENGISKKSLGSKCKLYIQKQWNSSARTGIPLTGMFINTMKEQMDMKARVKKGVLKVRFSTGHAKPGQEF